jgi:hypothetical protein
MNKSYVAKWHTGITHEWPSWVMRRPTGGA